MDIPAPTTSPDDERRLLSCILLDGSDTLARATNAGITARTFSDKRNRIVYEAVQQIAAAGQAVTPDALASQLQARADIDAIGGWAYFTQVTRSEITTSQAGRYIARLRNLEVLRLVHHEATTLAQACVELREEEPATIIDPAITRLLTAASGLGIEQDASWSEVIDQSSKLLEEMIAHGGLPKELAINWPWQAMDLRFAPMQRGQLVVLGARPSVGKSSLARPIAANAAATGKHTYFITLEVSPERVPLQIAAALSQVGLRQLHRAHKDDQDGIKAELQRLRSLPITITKRDRSVARICGRARAMAAQKKLDLIVIDHGLLLDDIRSANAGEMPTAISAVSKALKLLATDLNCVVMLLWQLNRKTTDDNREPDMHDLRGSGSLEEDADKILMIHRPTINPITKAEQHPSMPVEDCPRYFQNVLQVKGRDDGTSLMSFYFERTTARFMEISAATKPQTP
jgi:replicative DNA helicase